MKRSRILIALAVSAVALAAILGHSLAQTSLPTTSFNESLVAKLAVCDVAGVFNRYRRAQDLSAQFAERAQRMKTEDDQRKAAIDKLDKALESLREGSPEYEARLAEQEKLAVEREVWRNSQEQSAIREHRRLTEDMYKEVLDAIAAVAKEKRIDLLLYRESVDIASATTTELLNKIAQRKCLYCNPSIDVTELVLERLNRQYRGEVK